MSDHRDPVQISVIIPVYNAEAYVVKAASSVFAQTYEDIELLLVDDGSVDGSVAICERIAAENARVRVLRHEKNLGVAAARNTGVAAAKGEWIAFLDADDSWEPEKLARQMEAVAVADTHLCYTGAFFFRNGSDAFVVDVPARVSNKELRRGNVIISSSVLARKDDLLEFPMERSDLHEDFITWLRITGERGDAIGVDKPLVWHRLMKTSKSGAKLKSALMTWRTYRFMGYGFFARLCYFAHYTMHGLRRYR